MGYLFLEWALILLVPIPDRAENLRQLFVDGFSVVVQRRRLQNDGSRSDEDGQGKYPEE